MARFDNSPDLFGSGVGSSTVGRITCEFCGRTYNEDNEDAAGIIVDQNAESIGSTNFAGKEIADCCWEAIENEILSRMPDVLLWYARILRERRGDLQARERLLGDCIKALKGI